MKDLFKGLVIMGRVVHAVALRETRTRFGHNQLGYVWALLEPVFWVLTFWGMYKIAHRGGPFGMDLIPFLVTGLIPFQLVLNTAERASISIDANRALLFYPHVQPIDLILARGGLEIATGLTVLAILLGGVAMYDQAVVVDDLLQVMLGLGLAGLLGISLGTLLCAAGVLSKTVDRMRAPIMRPLFWLSGVYFAANSLPSFARDYLMVNPILHCVEIVRAGWFPSYHQTHADPLYVLAWILGFAFFGLTLERRVRPRVQLS